MLLKQRDENTVELTLSLSQVKQIYLALFRQLHSGGAAAFDALDEDDMLLTLQTYLQKRAAEAGVDATNHSAWDAFLGVPNALSCEARFGQRESQH